MPPSDYLSPTDAALCERLRKEAHHQVPIIAENLTEAAARIEALGAALKKARDGRTDRAEQPQGAS